MNKATYNVVYDEDDIIVIDDNKIILKKNKNGDVYLDYNNWYASKENIYVISHFCNLSSICEVFINIESNKYKLIDLNKRSKK